MTDDIFGMTAPVETNYHISSDEIDRIFDGILIHYNEVKHSTSDDYEQLKEERGRINPATFPTRFQKIQRDHHHSQCQWTWYGFYFAQ